jgi:hypothetical protein
MAATLSKMASTLLLIGLFFFNNACWSSDQLVVIGDAYSRDDNALLYQEFHYYSDDELDHRVVYKSADNEIIATKEIDYRSGNTTPKINYQGMQYPEVIKMNWLDSRLTIEYSELDNPPSTEILAPKKPLVIDAGFNYFIQQNWQKLVDGDSLDFYFPAPARLSVFKLMIKNTPCSYKTDTQVCYLINSSSWLIRLLLNDIELGYDLEKKQLKRFRGLGNMLDKTGKGLTVDIHYRYQALCDGKETCPPVDEKTL